MSKLLRYTGKNPPPELWRKYPNWRNAYEEEGLEGQNETTLMPHEEQTYIGLDTSFTGGIAVRADGHQFPAFLAVSRNGIDGCEVYQTDRPWRIYCDHQQKKWVSFQADWLPESERPPFVLFDDQSVFPLEMRMLVPWIKGGIPSVYKINADGDLHEISVS